jgi:hypothetical protein
MNPFPTYYHPTYNYTIRLRTLCGSEQVRTMERPMEIYRVAFCETPNMRWADYGHRPLDLASRVTYTYRTFKYYGRHDKDDLPIYDEVPDTSSAHALRQSEDHRIKLLAQIKDLTDANAALVEQAVAYKRVTTAQAGLLAILGPKL